MFNEENFNFHNTSFGGEVDFNPKKPYHSENRYMCYHDTGQFGSGTYFSTYRFENPEFYNKFRQIDDDKHELIQVDDKVYRVDFDLYKNLYRVKTEKQGRLLHTMMHDLNIFFMKVCGGLGKRMYEPSYDNSVLYQRIRMNATVLGLSCPTYLQLTRMAQSHCDGEGVQSFATLFMENNGYNGVNVSGVPLFDRYLYGSVIYDLSKVSSESIEPIDGYSDFTVFEKDKGVNDTIGFNYDFNKDDDEKYSNESYRNSLMKNPSVYLRSVPSGKMKRLVVNLVTNGYKFSRLDVEQIYRSRDAWRFVKNRIMAGSQDYFDAFVSSDFIGFIEDKGLMDFVNAKPSSYKGDSILVTWVDEIYWDESDIDDVKKLLNHMTRPLTEYEKSYIRKTVDGLLSENVSLRDIKKAIRDEIKKTNVNPSKAQVSAGNYRKGHITINGFQITVENPRGSHRKGVDENGNEYDSEMKYDYGYFNRTVGKDGDAIDVFIGNNYSSKRIFVVDQRINGAFDESKVMFCFNDMDSAKKGYLSCYDSNWKGFWKITEVSQNDFKEWLYDGHRQRKPFFQYASIQKQTRELTKQ